MWRVDIVFTASCLNTESLVLNIFYALCSIYMGTLKIFTVNAGKGGSIFDHFVSHFLFVSKCYLYLPLVKESLSFQLSVNTPHVTDLPG